MKVLAQLNVWTLASAVGEHGIYQSRINPSPLYLLIVIECCQRTY